MRAPFAIRRPWLLLRGARANRQHPDLGRLASIADPAEFVWTILPYAARTFSASILMLPEAQSRVAAIGYLYCRMLDTYEDQGPAGERRTALRAFAARMRTLEPPPAVQFRADDDREQVHVLLVERCLLVDRLFLTLPIEQRSRVVALVEAMAAGMIWSSERFADQGGVLAGQEQVRRYCHHVIGEPILFTMALLTDGELTPAQRSDALAVAELIQLANITRDVERDLERGIAYHPSLRSHFRAGDASEPIAAARRHLMAQALPQASAYARLARELPLRRISLTRASSVLMLLYTDSHYERTARRIGHPGWHRSAARRHVVLGSLMAALSRHWSDRIIGSVESDFLAAATSLRTD